jgi:hypothetical protein
VSRIRSWAGRTTARHAGIHVEARFRGGVMATGDSHVTAGSGEGEWSLQGDSGTETHADVRPQGVRQPLTSSAVHIPMYRLFYVVTCVRLFVRHMSHL